MPAIPAIIMAGSAIASSIAAKKAAENARKKTPEEQQAFADNSTLSQQQAQQGNQMFQTAMPGIKSSMGYYSTLLSGNRAARTAAMAPEAESISGAYQGANTAVGRSYVQGGQRDQALAENAKNKAGMISRLTTGVRPMAANALAGISGSILPGAAQRAGTAAGINSSQVNSEMLNRQYGDLAGQRTGENFGRLFAQIMNVTGKGKSSSGGGFYPVGGGGGSSVPGDDTGWG